MSESDQEMHNEGEWSSDATADIFASLAVILLAVSLAVYWVSQQ